MADIHIDNNNDNFDSFINPETVSTQNDKNNTGNIENQNTIEIAADVHMGDNSIVNLYEQATTVKKNKEINQKNQDEKEKKTLKSIPLQSLQKNIRKC